MGKKKTKRKLEVEELIEQPVNGDNMVIKVEGDIPSCVEMPAFQGEPEHVLRREAFLIQSFKMPQRIADGTTNRLMTAMRLAVRRQRADWEGPREIKVKTRNGKAFTKKIWPPHIKTPTIEDCLAGVEAFAWNATEYLTNEEYGGSPDNEELAGQFIQQIKNAVELLKQKGE